MTRRAAVLAVLAGLTCFALGVGATRLLGWGPPAAPAPTPTVTSPTLLFPVTDAGMRLVMPTTEGDASDAGPKILFDPDSITLLPDASLRLDRLGDAGLP